MIRRERRYDDTFQVIVAPEPSDVDLDWVMDTYEVDENRAKQLVEKALADKQRLVSCIAELLRERFRDDGVRFRMRRGREELTIILYGESDAEYAEDEAREAILDCIGDIIDSIVTSGGG